MSSSGKAASLPELLQREFADPLHQRLAALKWKRAISVAELAALCAIVDAALGLIGRGGEYLSARDPRDKRVLTRIQRALELLTIASLHHLKVALKKQHDLKAALGPFHDLCEAAGKLGEAARWSITRDEIQERLHFLDRKLDQNRRDLGAVDDWIARRLAVILADDEDVWPGLAEIHARMQAEMLRSLRRELGLAEQK
jgi:hypothetical protein